MHRAVTRPNSYAPPVTPGVQPYARHYVGQVDPDAWRQGISPLKGKLLITFRELWTDDIHLYAIAWDEEDAYSRARDLLILEADELDDPYAWAADIELVWIGTNTPLLHK